MGRRRVKAETAGGAWARSDSKIGSGRRLAVLLILTILNPALRTGANDGRCHLPGGRHPEGSSREALVISYEVREHVVIISADRPDAGRGGGAGGRIVAVPIERAAISSQIRLFRQLIVTRSPLCREIGRSLFETLITPVLPNLTAAQSLRIIPDDILWELPFQALVTPDGGYLIETVPILYLPSREALGVADDPRGDGLSSADSDLLLAVGSPLPANKRGLRQPGDHPAFSPLPEAVLEAKIIAGVHGERRSEVLTGRSATESAFRRLAPKRRFIHLATHGVIDNRNPHRSHLLLTPSGTDPANDGRLEVQEVRQLQLVAELAILAACETGRGSNEAREPGDRMAGLGHAFLEAGCRAVIVSLWKIDSRRTAELVSLFFQIWHDDGGQGSMGMALALRLTSLRMMRNQATRHPYYWAGMSVVARQLREKKRAAPPRAN